MATSVKAYDQRGGCAIAELWLSSRKLTERGSPSRSGSSANQSRRAGVLDPIAQSCERIAEQPSAVAARAISVIDEQNVRSSGVPNTSRRWPRGWRPRRPVPIARVGRYTCLAR